MTSHPRVADITVAVAHRGTPQTVRVSVTGELDDTTCRELDPLLTRSLAHVPQTLVLDLREVSFCGVAALRVLARCDHDRAARGGRLVVQCAPGGPVWRLLGIDGVLDGLTVVVCPPP